VAEGRPPIDGLAPLLAWPVVRFHADRAVDERTHEAQVLHGAHELVSASVGALHRQRGEAR
jgi:hypothetical protein